jgi:hypothetical protein
VDTGSLCQFYARKTRQVGPRKAIIALARKLLIVAWRMLLTGEVYRAAKAAVVARKQRELQRAIRIQLPATVPAQYPVPITRRPTAGAKGKEGVISCQRTLVSS